MTGFILRRILISIPVLLLLTFTVFSLMRAIPGGPFDRVGDRPLPQAVRKNLELRHHLNWPLSLQFSSYVIGDDLTAALCSGLPFINGCDIVLVEAPEGVSLGLIRGDLGMAYTLRGRTVNELVLQSFPISFQLGLISISLALLIGVPAGVLAAIRQNSIVDYSASFVAVLGLSIPNMVLGPLLIWIFPLQLGMFEISGWGAKPPFILGLFPPISTLFSWDFWAHAVLPAVTLGTAFSAVIARLTRASLLQVIREDYIRTARAKGLREQLVVSRHALRNSLIPVITVFAPLLIAIVTGSFIVEQIFGIPGMGRHFVTSIGNRDYPVITGVTLIYAALLVVANLAVDILYGWLDPRIRQD